MRASPPACSQREQEGCWDVLALHDAFKWRCMCSTREGVAGQPLLAPPILHVVEPRAGGVYPREGLRSRGTNWVCACVSASGMSASGEGKWRGLVERASEKAPGRRGIGTIARGRQRSLQPSLGSGQSAHPRNTLNRGLRWSSRCSLQASRCASTCSRASRVSL